MANENSATGANGAGTKTSPANRRSSTTQLREKTTTETMHQQEGTPTTAPSSAGAARGTPVMGERLRPWVLYDLYEAQATDTLDLIKDYFRRFLGCDRRPS
ncbi:hypothetical protein PC116_g20778 [Phytophthora cactorum]|uniref:Uncharacterized protein n=1 Tax=Phytophthora cactorum TaxID=29920 RepID=A0A8T1G301_9STRA|nr:hypothetical protein PC111_g19464 [Phytophthora cactorum]KAG2809054.1 hypothetical protein PC112_g16673 [Phytophthora cactorum]KAG2838133.1 hypothetical protein PC113_g19712 [Phytophthora cactorum]KAG2908037.1 hypothetical protein PC117_g20082 [Phytophthora cactorum]KAG2979976.1 hypothetical protein PC118_g11465 [Phytophthora cactorum]